MNAFTTAVITIIGGDIVGKLKYHGSEKIGDGLFGYYRKTEDKILVNNKLSSGD